VTGHENGGKAIAASLHNSSHQGFEWVPAVRTGLATCP
jgi:hypothetical protein